MYINITDSETADNKGSSGNLVHYLDKENRSGLEKVPEYWFNGKRDNIASYEAIPIIKRVTDEDVKEVYNKIKYEIEDLITGELASLKAKEILEEAGQKPVTMSQQEGAKSKENIVSKDQTVSM